MPKPKPLVIAALVCENVLIESDGIASVIRIAERLTIGLPDNAPSQLPGAIQITVFLAVKAGAYKGTANFSVRVRLPTGVEHTLPGKWSPRLDGDDHGANLRINIGLPLEFGLYWIDLMLEGEVLTSTPVRLVRADSPQTNPSPR